MLNEQYRLYQEKVQQNLMNFYSQKTYTPLTSSRSKISHLMNQESVIPSRRETKTPGELLRAYSVHLNNITANVDKGRYDSMNSKINNLLY